MTLTAENGRVSIVDSREKNVRHIIEADHFYFENFVMIYYKYH